MGILERIQYLCKKNEINPSKLETELGFGRGTLYKWDKSSPSTDKLNKIADYFKVSTDYLIYGFDKKLLSKLVQYALSGTTVADFAAETGADPQYIQNIIDEKIDCQPNIDVIKLIGNYYSNILVDVSELLKAAGYYDAVSHDNKTPKESFMIKESSNNYYTLAASRKDGYDEPLTEDEKAAVKAFLETYRKMKKDENKEG